jgi:hypothetical protein
MQGAHKKIYKILVDKDLEIVYSIIVWNGKNRSKSDPKFFPKFYLDNLLIKYYSKVSGYRFAL